MANGLNIVHLIGNLGNDVELKYSQGGMAIASVSLATSSTRKDKDGNPQTLTQWHRVKMFGRLAEIAGEYLRKGSQVYIQGEIRYDKYTDKEGIEKYTTDIIANEMTMLGGGGGERQRTERPARPETPPAQQAADDDGFLDQDIPF